MTTSADSSPSRLLADDPSGVGGTTRLAPEVVAAIAGHAAASVEGVTRLGTSNVLRSVADAMGDESRVRGRGVEVEAGQREAIFDIELTVAYGYSIPEIVASVRRAVSSQVRDLAGLEVRQVHITVASIDFPERAISRVE